MQFIMFILYVLPCVAVGLIGKDTRLGFWPTLIMSFVVTPIVMLIVVLLAERLAKENA